MPEEVKDGLWERYRRALTPLVSGGRLGMVLLQFPAWFRPGREAGAHLEGCRGRLAGPRVAVEFRHGGWLARERREATFALLRRLDAAFVCVDEPQGFASPVPPVAVSTAAVAVVRFHGRNAATWEAKGLASASERFNDRYTPEELDAWVPRILALAESAREVHLLMNTNYGDQAIVNARLLRARLGL